MTFDYDNIQDLMDGDVPINPSLSAGSASLALVAIYMMSERWRFPGISDGDWDTMDNQRAVLECELMTESMIGHIIPTMTEPKDNELLCDGTQYNRVDYPDLYATLQAEYIDSADLFHVPDLQNNFLVGAGDSYSPEDSGGEDAHELIKAELARHRHSISDYTANPDLEGLGVPDPLAVGLPKIQSADTSYTGDGDAHENRPPYLALTFVVVAI